MNYNKPIDDKHYSIINDFLDSQGLTFKPLRDEILDHLIADLESRIKKGDSFDEAWNAISANISENQFKIIQKETMEIFKKQFSLSKGFTYLSLFLLFSAALFKMLHFPLSGILLISSFVAIAASLIISSFYGIFLQREKKGGLMLLGVLFAIILFLASWIMQILSLPGFVQTRIIAVVFLVVLYPALTIYFNVKKENNENILTYLHDKHTPGIERFLMILLLVTAAIRIFSIISGYDDFVSKIILILVTGGAGLQFFALNWHKHDHNQNKTNRLLVTGLIIGFICFILPALGTILSFPIRILLVPCFFLISGIILLYRRPKIIDKITAVITVFFVIVLNVTWTCIRLNLLSLSSDFVVNIPVLLLLFCGLAFTYKSRMFKAYMILVIAGYLLEYPV